MAEYDVSKAAAWGFNKMLNLRLGVDETGKSFTIYNAATLKPILSKYKNEQHTAIITDGRNTLHCPLQSEGNELRVSSGKELARVLRKDIRQTAEFTRTMYPTLDCHKEEGNPIAALVMSYDDIGGKLDPPQARILQFFDAVVRHKDEIDINVVYERSIANVLAKNAHGYSDERLFDDILESYGKKTFGYDGAYILRQDGSEELEGCECERHTTAREIAEDMNIAKRSMWYINNMASQANAVLSHDTFVRLNNAKTPAQAMLFVDRLAEGNPEEKRLFERLAKEALAVDVVSRRIDNIDLANIAKDDAHLFAQALKTMNFTASKQGSGYELYDTNNDSVRGVYTNAEDILNALSVCVYDYFNAQFVEELQDRRDLLDELVHNSVGYEDLADVSLSEWVLIYDELMEVSQNPEALDFCDRHARDFEMCSVLAFRADLVDLDKACAIMSSGKDTSKVNDVKERE